MNCKKSMLMLLLVALGATSQIRPMEQSSLTRSLERSVIEEETVIIQSLDDQQQLDKSRTEKKQPWSDLPKLIIKNETSWKLHVTYCNKPFNAENELEKKDVLEKHSIHRVLVPNEMIIVDNEPSEITYLTVGLYGDYKRLLSFSTTDHSKSLKKPQKQEDEEEEVQEESIRLTISEREESSIAQSIKSFAVSWAPRFIAKTVEVVMDTIDSSLRPFVFTFTHGSVIEEIVPTIPVSGNPLDAFPNAVYALKQGRTPTAYQILGIPKISKKSKVSLQISQESMQSTIDGAYFPQMHAWQMAKEQFAEDSHESNLIHEILDLLDQARAAFILQTRIDSFAHAKKMNLAL